MPEENLRLYFKEFIKDNSRFPSLTPRGTPDYVCDLFVYEPRNVEEAHLGSLFMLGKITNIPKNKYRNFDFLLSLLVSVIKREFYSNSNRLTLEALEVSLNKANLYLSDFAEKGNVEWIGNLTFICGAFSKNTFHITQTGRPIIKLFRGTTVSHLEHKFPTQKKYHPLKTFGNIASGTILNGDKIVLGLKEIPGRSYNQIIEFLKKTIENKIDKSPVVCLVLEAKNASEKVLVCSRGEAGEKMLQQDRLSRQKSFISLVCKQASLGIYKLLLPLFRKIKIPVSNKPAFFVASALLILILILPFSIAQKINYHIKMDRLNKLSAEIQEIQRKTDLALIYQDKNKAKALIQKSQALIIELLKYAKELKELPAVIALQAKHQEQQDSISNVIRIKNLEEILDFSASGFIVNPVGINKIDDRLYFYEPDSGILYKFSLGAEKKDITLIFISAKDELRKMVSLENGQIVLFGQSGKIYIYDSNVNEYEVYSLEPAISVENIKDVKNFFSNFYILSTKGDIIKYSNELRGNSWFSESDEEAKSAQSMAIDGSIYVLGSNGIITKYFRGEKIKEIYPNLEKPLAGNNKIFIKEDFKNLYVSDPENKRLIILNKDGEILNQYVSDEFSNLQDFWVAADEKKVYVLCGKKVFKLEL